MTENEKPQQDRDNVADRLDGLPNPITIPVLAEALKYQDPTSLNRAVRDGRLKATQVGKIYLIWLDDVREALKSGKIRPRLGQGGNLTTDDSKPISAKNSRKL